MHERGDDRQGQHGLREHHRARGEQHAETSKRTRAREKQIESEAGDHRGKPQQCIEHHDKDLPARKGLDRERRSQRRPGERGQSSGGNAYRERERDDTSEPSEI